MISEQIFTTHEMQHIKAQEFELFFQRFRGKYSPHLNHLGEINWMTDAEAADQHEYFDYEAGFWQRLKHKFAEKPSASMAGISQEEKELRLQFRIYLEKKYLGEIQPETIRQFPANWQVELSDDEIEQLLKSFQTMKNLLEFSLNISFTNFHKNSLQNLCVLIEDLPNLCELSLEMEAIKLKGKDYFSLLFGIKKLKGLCSLALRINESDIGDDGIKIIAESILVLENLSAIELRINKNISNLGLDYLLNTFIVKKNQLTSIKLFFNLTSIENLNKIANVVESQKYLTELILSFRGVMKTSVEAEQDIIRSINNSLYLFTCILIPSFWIDYSKINNKAKVVPILQIITSQLRRKKYRKEIIEEIIEIIKKSNK